MAEYFIGIDPGAHTGVCVWNKELKFIRYLDTMKIHEAMDEVKSFADLNDANIIVIVEDARQATFGRQKDLHKAQGAGSVKRDCAIWDDFLKSLGVEYRMVRPKKAKTKLTIPAFSALTKYMGLTSQHARDAALLVFGM